MLTVVILAMLLVVLAAKPLSFGIDSALQWLTAGGTFLAGLGDYQNQQAAAKKAEEAQRQAISDAFKAQQETANIGRGIADRENAANNRNISIWKQSTDRAVNDWYKDWEKRGGTLGQVQPGLDKLGANAKLRATKTEATATKRADAALAEQAAQQEADRTQVLNDSSELKSKIGESIAFGRNTFNQLREKFAADVEATRAGGVAVMDFLKKGVSEQIAGAVSSTKTALTKALGEFEASWKGARDQNYFVAKQAIETQYNNAGEKGRSEKQEGFNIVAADTLAKVNDTTANVRSSAQAAEGQAYYGLTSAEAEDMRTLGINFGDVASFMSNQEKVRGDLQGSLNTSLNSLRETNSTILADTGKFISTSVQNAINTDEATRATYSDLKRQTADQELAARSSAEATYSNWLFGTLDRSSTFAQLGINLTYAQNFGVPLLAPTFQNLFNNIDTFRQTQLSERQVATQEFQADTQAWQGGLGLGLSAAQTGTSAASAFKPSYSPTGAGTKYG